MNKERPLVSVIIPVYNAYNYIQKCAETLLNQTLKNIEIIFILDHPTDGTDLYIKSLSKKDERIVVLENTENLHVGLSRNKGLEIAKGEYIGFSDHDDWQDPRKLEKLYYAAKRCNADIAIGTPCYVDELNNDYRIYPIPSCEDHELLQILTKLLIGDNYDDEKWNFFKTHGVIWDKIFKNTLLLENGIRFVDTRILTYEDNLFCLEAFLAAKRITCINDIVYYHRINDNNTSGTYSYSNIYKVIKYLHRVFNIIDIKNIDYQERFRHSILSYIIFSLSMAIKNVGLLYFLKAIMKIREDSLIVKTFKSDYIYIYNACKLTPLGKSKIWLTKLLITAFK